jgi:hypothetical protein
MFCYKKDGFLAYVFSRTRVNTAKKPLTIRAIPIAIMIRITYHRYRKGPTKAHFTRTSSPFRQITFACT